MKNNNDPSRRKPRRIFSESAKPTRSENTNPKGKAKESTKPDQGDLVRLNKYISNAGICSRRDADGLIEKGEITVNGKVVTELGSRVKPNDVVKYKNKVLRKENHLYVLLNKPKDFITTMEDPDNRRTVMDLVKNAGNERIYPVGRLDRNTTGLLLLTNDGELAEYLTHPSNRVKKIYQADLNIPISEEHFDAIRNGIELEDGPIKPDDIQILSKDRKILGIEIHEGRNRIVRRVFEHFNYEVERLDRVMYAGLTKKDLTRGKYRILSPKEIINLKYLNKR